MDDLALLRELSDNPELYLDDEDRELLQSNKELLDVSKSTSITLYGSDIQKKMAELSEMMIKSIGETNVDEISETIDQTVAYLAETDDNDDKEEEKGLFFWKKKSKSLSIQNRYDVISQNVEKIEGSLQAHQVRLMKDTAMLDQIYKMNQEYFRLVNLKIAAAKDKLELIRGGDYPADCADIIPDIIDRLERKILELETTRTIAIQQAPQIRMLQANAAAMADKLQSTLYTVIPLWKNQIVIAFGTEHTRAAIAADKKLTDMSNQLLIKNAQNLKMLTIETQKARDENTIDPKALGEANRILIESLDDITRIQQEGKLKRYQAEQELAKIDEEMKGRLFQLSSDS
ncbi:Uncharacterized conserved protein YaaN involved in tellurite resistance [Lachnospiraceae bacterium NE2001]|nr:Uncharacterized conserved protein YaaN involved in tellurite resistance [Lachnospiraceae bacterium NE2001]